MGIQVNPYYYETVYSGSDAAKANEESADNTVDFLRLLGDVSAVRSSHAAEKTASAQSSAKTETSLPETGAEKDKSETNWNAVVDPDGSIYSAAYIGSVVSQQQGNSALPDVDALINSTGIHFNDPYALASSGGALAVDAVDRIARSTAQARLDALISDFKAANGIRE